MTTSKRPAQFIPRVYFLYNNTKHAFLSEKGGWTTVFWEARAFKSFAAVYRAFESSLPEDATYQDCEIFAAQGLWIKPPV